MLTTTRVSCNCSCSSSFHLNNSFYSFDYHFVNYYRFHGGEYFIVSSFALIDLYCSFVWIIAWYDDGLIAYQKEREENELEKVFEERNALTQQGGEVLGLDHLKQPKVIKEPQPEWTNTVRQKKTDDYYSKLREVDLLFLAYSQLNSFRTDLI